jgi:hypothetical protein
VADRPVAETRYINVVDPDAAATHGEVYLTPTGS